MVSGLTILFGVGALVALLAPQFRVVGLAMAGLAAILVLAAWSVRLCRVARRNVRVAAVIALVYIPSIPLTFGLSLLFFPVAVYCVAVLVRYKGGWLRDVDGHLPTRI